MERFRCHTWTERPTVMNSHCHGTEKNNLYEWTVRKPTSEEDHKIVLGFYDTYMYSIIINYCELWSGRKAPWMSITFENEADILLWTIAKWLDRFKQRHYLYATEWIWWIVALVWLDPALLYYLEYRRFPSEESNSTESKDIPAESLNRGVSSAPLDTQWQSISIGSERQHSMDYQADSLRGPWKGMDEPFPTTNKQLLAGRNRLVKQQANKNCILG